MIYTDVLTVPEAKLYLKIDDLQNEDDAEIRNMINAAFSYLEKATNHLFIAREKTYPLAGKNCINVYDFPINSVVKGVDKSGADVTLTFETNYNKTVKTLHTVYHGIDSSAESIVLNVGHTNPDNVPSDLVEAAKVIVGVLYYNKEAESIESVLPLSVKMMIDANKRFIV